MDIPASYLALGVGSGGEAEAGEAIGGCSGSSKLRECIEAGGQVRHEGGYRAKCLPMEKKL